MQRDRQHEQDDSAQPLVENGHCLAGVGRVRPATAGQQIVGVGDEPIGLIEKEDAECDPHERRDRVAARVRIDPRDDEAREGRRQHHSRGKAQCAVQCPLGRVAPDKHQRRPQEVQRGDDDPADEPLDDRIGPDEPDEQLRHRL